MDRNATTAFSYSPDSMDEMHHRNMGENHMYINDGLIDENQSTDDESLYINWRNNPNMYPNVIDRPIADEALYVNRGIDQRITGSSGMYLPMDGQRRLNIPSEQVEDNSTFIVAPYNDTSTDLDIEVHVDEDLKLPRSSVRLDPVFCPRCTRLIIIVVMSVALVVGMILAGGLGWYLGHNVDTGILFMH